MLRKLFFGINMTWKKVIIFAVVTAIITAAVLIMPITANTSFANMGVSFECWILFALIIIMNCEKPIEAGVKTFVFFLISQPLIYLFQVPFYIDGWRIFQYYPRWFILTLLCFPGAIIAWFVKKDNILSAVILSVATGFLGVECMYYLSQCMDVFPKHLLTVIFTALLAVVLIFVLLKNKRGRIVASVITLIATLAAFYILVFNKSVPLMGTDYYLEEGHTWTVTSQEGDDIGTVRIDPDTENMMLVNADKYGTQNITVTNEENESVDLVITYDKANGIVINEK